MRGWGRGPGRECLPDAWLSGGRDRLALEGKEGRQDILKLYKKENPTAKNT